MCAFLATVLLGRNVEQRFTAVHVKIHTSSCEASPTIFAGLAADALSENYSSFCVVCNTF